MDDAEPRVAGSTTLRNQAAFIELGLALRRDRDEFAAQITRGDQNALALQAGETVYARATKVAAFDD